jgi:hypothetical protein
LDEVHSKLLPSALEKDVPYSHGNRYINFQIMKHLLLARFQGALLGGNTIYVNPHQMKPNQLMAQNLTTLYGGIESLIRCEGFSREDWLQSTVSTIEQPPQAMVTTLPLMLFFHDDRAQLADVLTQVHESWELDEITSSAILAIGYLLSQAITENLDPTTIIPEILAALVKPHPIVSEQLTTAHDLLDRYASLHQVRSAFKPPAHPMAIAIALASYCFLSMPEDFSLAIRLANQIKYQNQLICALTGILAGAHNSFTGIPLRVCLATQGREQLLRLSERLLAVWSGVYQSEHSHPLQISTVAAPSVIQRR